MKWSSVTGLMLACTTPLFGQTAGMLSFQGLIKDSNGDPVSGTVNLEFRFFDAQVAGNLLDADGDSIDGENVVGQDVIGIPEFLVTNGVVSTPFGPVSHRVYDVGSSRWLEVSVDGVPLSRVEVLPVPVAQQLHLSKPSSGEAWKLRPVNSNFDIGFQDENNTTVFGINADTSETEVRVLKITGGADLAEPFHVSSQTPEDRPIEPGMVVSIDANGSGQLAIASKPYDRAVAGIISGANGLQPGMVMRSEGDPHTDGTHNVALTGRVWTWCDASFGVIEPGDRLTTSATAGHAMKVTDNNRAIGAVIGKAMTPLKEGKGLVLVLVQPQ